MPFRSLKTLSIFVDNQENSIIEFYISVNLIMDHQIDGPIFYDNSSRITIIITRVK